MISRRAQVWIETVLYTLIGLALIGLALGFIMPKITESKDKILVEQAINSLSVLDGKINTVIQTGAGNVRNADFSMKKGEIYFNVTNDEVIFVLRGLSKPYSEPGVEIREGRITIVTLKEQKTNTIYMKVNYNANLTFSGKDENRKFDAAAVSYVFSAKNVGAQGSKDWIDITEISNR